MGESRTYPCSPPPPLNPILRPPPSNIVLACTIDAVPNDGSPPDQLQLYACAEAYGYVKSVRLDRAASPEGLAIAGIKMKPAETDSIPNAEMRPRRSSLRQSSIEDGSRTSAVTGLPGASAGPGGEDV